MSHKCDRDSIEFIFTLRRTLEMQENTGVKKKVIKKLHFADVRLFDFFEFKFCPCDFNLALLNNEQN